MTGQQLRNSILQEAIQGRLVLQNSGDEPASILFESIQQEKTRRIKDGRLKKDKVSSFIPEDEIPFEIPVSWKWVRIQDIFNVRSALRIHQSDWQSDGIPFFRGRELVQLANSGTTKPEIFISRELYETNKGKGGVPQKNDLLVSAVGTIGKVYIVQGTKEFYYKDAYILCFENYADIYVKYIKYALDSPYLQEEIHRDAMATTVAQLTIIKAKSLMIPLPPLEEQKRIVAKIEELLPLVDEYDRAAGELKTLNEALPDKLRKSVLQEAIHGNLVPNEIPAGEATAQELLQQILKERQDRENAAKGKKAKKLTLSEIEEEPWELPEGWCWCKMGDMFEIVRGGSPRPIKDFITNDESGYNWIKIGDTDKGGKYITSAKEKIIREGLRKTRLVHTGDLLLTNSMSFGRPYILKIDGCIHDGWLVLSPYIQELNKEFIFYLLSTPYVYEIFSEKAAGGVVNNLKTEKVFDTIVPLPPLSIQKAIVAKIEEVFAAIDKLT